MRQLLIYADTSAIGGCEDPEFSRDSLALWAEFVRGTHLLVLSEHTLRELHDAPQAVRDHLSEVPQDHQLLLDDSEEAADLAETYLHRGILGPGSTGDALHIALATVARVDVLVSWNFKHIVNLGRIRLFHSVNVELGYGPLEIRTPTEVLQYA